MKATRLNSQKGFTLIEVSLAIVIGIIVLGGAIVLYNQTKTSSANSAAGTKSLALQTVVEEMAIANAGDYTKVTVASLASGWASRRPTDYNTSPFGGTIVGGAIQALPAYPASTSINAGAGVYASGAATYWDNNAVSTKSFTQYAVGICDKDGVQGFLNGK